MGGDGVEGNSSEHCMDGGRARVEALSFCIGRKTGDDRDAGCGKPSVEISHVFRRDDEGC